MGLAGADWVAGAEAAVVAAAAVGWVAESVRRRHMPSSEPGPVATRGLERAGREARAAGEGWEKDREEAWGRWD